MTSTEIATITAGALAAAGIVYKYLRGKHGKDLQDLTNVIDAVKTEKTAALEAINEIKTLIENAKDVSADGKITPEEMEKIFNEIIEIANSPSVEKLLTEFGA